MGSILNLAAGEMGTTTTFPWVHLQAAWLNLPYKGSVSWCCWSAGSKSQCPVKCPSLSFCRTFTLRQLMPSTCKATHSLLKSSPSTPQFGQFGGSAGVCVCPSVCGCMLACLTARVCVHACSPHACVCMRMKEGVYVEGVAARSWKVLKVGVLVVVGGWLLFGWV